MIDAELAVSADSQDCETSPENGQSIWQPWTPEIGQRVRVRLSGECLEDWGTGPVGHPEWADGVCGVVDAIWPDGHGAFLHEPDRAAYERHPYLVLLDEYGPGATRGLWLAAVELEPLDWDGPRHPDADD